MANRGERRPGAALPAGPALPPAPPTGFLGLLTGHQRRSVMELGAVHLYRRGRVIMCARAARLTSWSSSWRGSPG